MRKKVLLAEQSDATRSVAETILRQNGFEVVSVADGERAADVLAHGRPDLIIVGVELSVGGHPLFEYVKTDKRNSSAPLLVFNDAGAENPAMPAEHIIPRPFDPRDFLDRVNSAAAAVPANADGGMSLDDEFLDAALETETGGINITDSEVLDKTTKMSSAARASKAHAGHSEGYGLGQSNNEELGETGRVESIVLNDSQTDVRRAKTNKTDDSSGSADSGGLDILENQYDLQANEAELAGDREHDYHWFVNEMQQETVTPANDKKPKVSDTDASPSDALVFTDSASTLEPFKIPADTPSTPGGAKDGGGVEKFIDEFKKEIEKFHADEPESVTLREESPEPVSDTDWEETIENITPEKVELFTQRLASDLAERIAERLVSKLDSDKLLHLIKTEIVNELRRRGKK